MLSNIAVNYYRSIHPFLGSPFHQKVVVQINGVVSGVNRMKVLEYCPLSKKTGSLQRVPSSLQHALPAQKGVFHMIFYTLFQRRVKMYPVPAWIRHCCFPQQWRRADCAHRSSPRPLCTGQCPGQARHHDAVSRLNDLDLLCRCFHYPACSIQIS